VGREGREKQREGKNDKKGLQCPEFLTWKVDNPSLKKGVSFRTIISCIEFGDDVE